MKRAIWILLTVLLVASIGMSQEPPQKPETKAPEAPPAEPLPTVDLIFDKYVEAMGGKAAIEKLTSRLSRGTFDIPAMGASGSLTSYAKAPNKVSMAIDIPGFGVVQQAFDGTVAWGNNPMTGLTVSSGAALASAKRDSVFHRELKLKEQYKKVEVKAKQKIGDKDVYLVEATPDEGNVEKWYFDVTTGLLQRVDAERESPQGSAVVESTFKDYREVDGVKIPFTIEQVMPAMTIIVKFDEVKHNVDIEDAKFTKPSA